MGGCCTRRTRLTEAGWKLGRLVVMVSMLVLSFPTSPSIGGFWDPGLAEHRQPTDVCIFSLFFCLIASKRESMTKSSSSF